MAASRLCFLGSLIMAAIFVCVFSVDLRIDQEEPEERECYGTTVGFGYSGTREFHYQQLRKRYAGCTYIHGNLEITHLLDMNIDYDLSFLKTIRYVSGYVLMGLITEVDYIPMDSLEVIRGNSTFNIMGDEYSLVVVLTAPANEETSGLKELHMPKLKEISAGKVLFTKNPSLGYVNTINWEPIMRGHWDHVHFHDLPFDETVADNNDTSLCQDGARWGDAPSLCQNAVQRTCHENCDGRCFGPGETDCCHNSCAVGCDGPSDEECFVCKDYLYDTHCVGFCPAKSYPKMQDCIKY